MKQTKLMAIGTLMLFIGGITNATGQSTNAATPSLGDAARAARKKKVDTATASHHFDNDNLPTSEGLSVVGPAPASGAAAADTSQPANPASAAAEKQKAADEWKDKIDKQQAKIDALNHELDLDQREMRLRAAAVTVDPTLKARNVQWDKEDAQFQSDVDSKQKAIDEARRVLDDLKDNARKAGVTDSDKEKDNQNSDKDK